MTRRNTGKLREAHTDSRRIVILPSVDVDDAAHRRRAARTIVSPLDEPRRRRHTDRLPRSPFMSTATLLLFILASAVAIVTPAPPCCWP